MKKLVVYYSFQGNCKFMAENIADEIGADLLELKPKKSIPSKGFGKFFFGGFQVFFKRKPELYELEKNPEGYDLIFLGSPVWAGKYASPFNTFFSKFGFEGKKIALFAAFAGERGKIFDEFKNELKDNQILGEIGIKNPMSDKGRNSIEVRDWSKSIVNQS